MFAELLLPDTLARQSGALLGVGYFLARFWVSSFTLKLSHFISSWAFRLFAFVHF
jgi:hypothetical protein